MGKFVQKYRMVYCIEGFWEVQEDTYDIFSIFQAFISLSVSTINAM